MEKLATLKGRKKMKEKREGDRQEEAAPSTRRG